MTKEKYFFEREFFSKPGYKFGFNPDKELIKEILKYKKKGRLLELGCGEGGKRVCFNRWRGSKKKMQYSPFRAIEYSAR